MNKLLKGNDPIVIDVRSKGEYDLGFFPGAINIPLDEIESNTGILGAKDREITLYCASGGRSSSAVRILQKYDFSNLKNGGGLRKMMKTLKK